MLVMNERGDPNTTGEMPDPVVAETPDEKMARALRLMEEARALINSAALDIQRGLESLPKAGDA